MKRNVQLSNFCFFATAITLALLFGCTFIMQEAIWMIPWGVFCVATLTFSLYYAPLSIEVTNTAIVINRSLSFAKQLPLADIKDIKPYRPKNAVRTCGSGGFLGYWGWFAAPEIGKYFAYHGKTADCFLVELTDGRKYLLGCKDYAEIVNRVKSLINNQS